jgi:dihydrodipicolinate synthase/N-acetylneuraminate lyase
MDKSNIPSDVFDVLKKGTVIPALPLTLDAHRKWDEEGQLLLLRYYLDAGAGGLAVGVHSTQFEIREAGIDLFKPLLAFASKAIDRFSARRPVVKIAGVCGPTAQAALEADYAREQGYHAALLSLSAFAGSSIKETLSHCREIARHIPLFGFYLQPVIGGRRWPYRFWRDFAEIGNVIGIKMAPFNRYCSLDVVRGIVDAGREQDIMLYTGNDDNIVADLLTEYSFSSGDRAKRCRVRGGLLGHWAVWTRKAVELLDEIHRLTGSQDGIPRELMTRAAQITDANAAFFDAANDFRGCIPGIHEVLRRQGLMKNRYCLHPGLDLSPGQKEEIDRVLFSYPHLSDDDFVRENIDRWIG